MVCASPFSVPFFIDIIYRSSLVAAGTYDFFLEIQMFGLQFFARRFRFVITVFLFNTWVGPFYFVRDDLHKLSSQKNFTRHRKDSFPVCSVRDTTMTPVFGVIGTRNVHCCVCTRERVVRSSGHGKIILVILASRRLSAWSSNRTEQRAN